jgi:hypothetical protein
MAEKRTVKIRKMRLLTVSGSYVAKACRLALSPLLAATRPEISTEARDWDHETRIKSDYEHLIRLWRGRINELMAHRWRALPNIQKYIFAANCPPAGVRVQHKDLRSCHHRTICPWCWCRQNVRETFYRFSRVLYAGGDDVPYPYHLVLVRTSRHYPDGPDGWNCEEVVQDLVKHNKGAYYQLSMKAALGATSLCTIEPPRPYNQNPCWTVQHRILALVRADDERDYYVEPDLGQLPEDKGAYAIRSVERIEFPKRWDLAGAIGKYAEYPVQMMTSGPAQAIRVYNSYSAVVGKDAAGQAVKRNGVRLSAVYGILRGKLLLPDDDHDQIAITSMESADDFAQSGKPARRADRLPGVVRADGQRPRRSRHLHRPPAS